MLNQDAVTIRDRDRKVSTAGGGVAEIDYKPATPVPDSVRAKVRDAGRALQTTKTEK